MGDQSMSNENAPASTPTPLFRAVLLSLLIALAVVTGFAFYQRNAAKQMAAQNQQIAATLSQTHTQIDELNAKLNSVATTLSEAAQSAKPQARPAKAASPSSAKPRRDDPRWKKMQAQLDEQGRAIDSTRQDIDSTRQDLAGTRTELQGSIARTHDELVVLQKKGERNYYEFDLSKAKQFQREGPLGVRLKKANPKRQYADLELMVDDADVSQKHVNLFQPVIFYAGDNGRPVEVVINKITSNHIHGYVSEPKYRQSELASMTNTDANAGASPEAASGETAATAPAPRRKLPPPK